MIKALICIAFVIVLIIVIGFVLEVFGVGDDF